MEAPLVADRFEDARRIEPEFAPVESLRSVAARGISLGGEMAKGPRHEAGRQEVRGDHVADATLGDMLFQHEEGVAGGDLRPARLRHGRRLERQFGEQPDFGPHGHRQQRRLLEDTADVGADNDQHAGIP